MKYREGRVLVIVTHLLANRSVIMIHNDTSLSPTFFEEIHYSATLLRMRSAHV